MSVEIDPRDLRDLSRLMNEMQDLTQRETKVIVRNMGRDFTKLALRLTPLAPKQVKRTKGKRKGATRRIFGRGFARAGWLKALRGLGVQVKARWDQFGGKKAVRLSAFVDGLSSAKPFVIIANQIPMIELLNNKGGRGGQRHFFQKTLTALLIKTETTLERLSKKQARAWKR